MMYQKLKDLFTKNLSWKAFSILMATLLWFIVMNINNPTEIKTFSMNINISNLSEVSESNFCILNIDEIKDTKVEIKLKATRPVLDEVTRRIANNEIKAYVDTASIFKYPEFDEPLDINLPIKTTLPSIPYPNNNFEIVSFSPTNISIKLDNKITVPKKVYVKLVGNVKSGYVYSNPEISSEYVQITGGKSILEKISSVVVQVNISNKANTFTEQLKPIAYDKFGNEIKDITFNLETIDVKIPINIEGKIDIAKPKLTGNLKEGLTIKDISYSPKNICVIGDEHSLKSISAIELPKIDVSNLEHSQEFSFKINDLINQYNIRLKNENVSEIKVFIEIEKIENKILNIPSSKLNISGVNDKFIALPDFFEIEISGSKEDMKNLLIDNIEASININDLDNGEYKLPIDVSLPKGITLSKTPYIDITIKKEMQSET